MMSRVPALLLALALLAGGTAWAPGPMGAMDDGCGMETPAPPCDMPCGDDAPAQRASCCDLDAPAPTDAVVPPVTPRLDPSVVVLARALVPVPPPAIGVAEATRYGPPRPPVRRHLAVSVVLI